MSAGIEPLARSIRIWWRDAEGKIQRETYLTPTTLNAQRTSQSLSMPNWPMALLIVRDIFQIVSI